MILICRQYLPGTLDDLQPGYTIACCDICECKVQISPRSIGLFKAGQKPLCNACAARVLEEIGHQNVDLAMTPEAWEQFYRLIAKMKKH